MFDISMRIEDITKTLINMVSDIFNRTVDENIMYAELYLGVMQQDFIAKFAHTLFNEMDNAWPLKNSTKKRKKGLGVNQPNLPYYESGEFKRNLRFKYYKPKGTNKGEFEIYFDDEDQKSERGLTHRQIFEVMEFGTVISSTQVKIPERPVIAQTLRSMRMYEGGLATKHEADKRMYVYRKRSGQYFSKMSSGIQEIVRTPRAISVAKNKEIYLIGRMVESSIGNNEWICHISNEGDDVSDLYDEIKRTEDEV